jgi:hypothetical protein
MSPELQTQFTNRAGQGCGQRAVGLHRTQEMLRDEYVVDETNVEGLLTTISACAVI